MADAHVEPDAHPPPLDVKHLAPSPETTVPAGQAQVFVVGCHVEPAGAAHVHDVEPDCAA